jgi:hypothetical protein
MPVVDEVRDGGIMQIENPKPVVPQKDIMPTSKLLYPHNYASKHLYNHQECTFNHMCSRAFCANNSKF